MADQLRTAVLAYNPVTPGDFRHGTRAGHQYWICRCLLCRDWYNAMQRAYRVRRMARSGERMINGHFVSAPRTRPQRVFHPPMMGIRPPPVG